MLPEKLTTSLSELRLDFEGANTGKFRIGLALTVATVVVTGSGWPPAQMVERAIFFVLATLPCAAVGLGLVVGELIQARTDRRGELRADDREIRALRATIAEEAEGGILLDSRSPPTSRRRDESRPSYAASSRSHNSGPRQLVGRRSSYRLFRTGFLGLR